MQQVGKLGQVREALVLQQGLRELHVLDGKQCVALGLPVSGRDQLVHFRRHLGQGARERVLGHLQEAAGDCHQSIVRTCRR